MDSDAEKQRFAVQVLANAFRRSLEEHIGSLENKPPTELVAWSKALIEMEQAIRQQLLQTYEGLPVPDEEQSQ